MNDIVLAALVVVGTVAFLGGGGWLLNVLTRKPEKKDVPKG